MSKKILTEFRAKVGADDSFLTWDQVIKRIKNIAMCFRDSTGLERLWNQFISHSLKDKMEKLEFTTGKGNETNFLKWSKALSPNMADRSVLIAFINGDSPIFLNGEESKGKFVCGYPKGFKDGAILLDLVRDFKKAKEDSNEYFDIDDLINALSKGDKETHYKTDKAEIYYATKESGMLYKIWTWMEGHVEQTNKRKFAPFGIVGVAICPVKVNGRAHFCIELLLGEQDFRN